MDRHGREYGAPAEYVLSRQLEEFGVPLLPGGLANQPMGYLADVMRVRSYARSKEAVDRERKGGTNDDGAPRMPAPAWAWRDVLEVEQRLDELADDEYE